MPLQQATWLSVLLQPNLCLLLSATYLKTAGMINAYPVHAHGLVHAFRRSSVSQVRFVAILCCDVSGIRNWTRARELGYGMQA